MIKIWSELRIARLKEQVADLATLVWVVFWGNLAWQLLQLLAGFAQAGRTIHDSGQGMIRGGRALGDSLSGIPLIGSGVQDIVPTRRSCSTRRIRLAIGQAAATIGWPAPSSPAWGCGPRFPAWPGRRPTPAPRRSGRR